MMMKKIRSACLITLLVGFVWGPVTGLADDFTVESDTIIRALQDEMQRSMKELQLEGLPRPFFMQYVVRDWQRYTIMASYGGLSNVSQDRSRTLSTRVRVGSYELDNSKVGGFAGWFAALPIDDDYVPMRHAIWRATDQDYKLSVEFLARKKALLSNKNVEDRPDDFSRIDPVVAIEPQEELAIDIDKWKERVRALSARFANHTGIQDSWVSLFAGAGSQYCINSEGTRVRMKGTGVWLQAGAQMQADDGMYLQDAVRFLALQPEGLPPSERMLAEIDGLCDRLAALSKAPVLDRYTGPVLFEPAAAGKVIEALLATGLAARPTAVGESWADESMENKLDRRILPRSFQIHDDPQAEYFEGTLLVGSYTFDDEGVPAQRVDLVEDGVLKTLLASRSPTRKIKHSTGHGQAEDYGDAQANIGCLYVSDVNGISAEGLKEELIEAARDEGLEFGLRVASMESGSTGYLGDPIVAYKVYVEDGREELVRGLEFAEVKARVLKRILAAGTERKVHNRPHGISASIISPAILIEELELAKVDREFDKPPLLESPLLR